MKKYIVYMLAALIGFHLRWTAAHLAGADYSMNGADIAVASVCIISVWSFKGAFLTERRTSRVHHKRAHTRHNAVSKRTEP